MQPTLTNSSSHELKVLGSLSRVRGSLAFTVVSSADLLHLPLFGYFFLL